jgi:hypothetical protein
VSPFVESTVAAALAHIDRAYNYEMDSDARKYLLLAVQELRGAQQMAEVERNLAIAGHPPTPLRVVR